MNATETKTFEGYIGNKEALKVLSDYELKALLKTSGYCSIRNLFEFSTTAL